MAHNITDWKLTYDVLEPIKAPINPYRDIGNLIDIRDDEEKLNDLELIGSDLDNIKKSSFDLLDLFQNIYVTPSHVRKKGKVEKPHIDYEDFFQKLETGEKIDWCANPTTSKDVPQNNTTDDINGRSNEYQDQKKNENSIGPNILKTVGYTENIFLRHQSEKNVKNNNAIESTLNVHKLTPTLNIARLCNTSVSELEKPFKNNDHKVSMPIQNQTIPQMSGPINNQQATLETIKTINLPKKTYNKHRHVRTELEKLRYIKGPDLCEKSVILPQIMKRLTDRDNALQDNAHLRRRLVLDSSKNGSQCQCNKGAPTKQHNDQNTQHTSYQTAQVSSSQVTANNDIKLNPIIALENCNYERLIAHRVHSAFEKYILTGSYY